MQYIIKPAPICLAVDSVGVFSDTALDAACAYGARVILTYAEVLTAAVLQRYLGKGYGVGVLTFSRAPGWVPSAETGAADAARALDVVHSLGVPAGVGLFDDVEGPAAAAGPEAVMAHEDAFGQAVLEAGEDVAGVYIGYGTLLTSAEWYARPTVHRYYKGGGITRDRNGLAIEPDRGWCAVQSVRFNQALADARVDFDFLTPDQRGDCWPLIYAA